MPKKTCSQLNNAQRKQICEYHIKNPSAKHQDIADEFKRRYPKLNLERSTYPLIEIAINIWVGQVSATGLVLTDELVKSKGCEFGSLLGISENELKFSNGWVTNYKKRNSLRRYKLHGEAASASLESLPNEKIKLQNFFSKYELENVYNADETGLFYRMLPNQTLAKRPVAESKQVTVLLAANATGSHKLQPLVIGHSKKPRSFSDIWEKWLHYIDSEFCIQDRKILLLVDNAPSHSSPESNKTLSVNNVEVDNNQLNSENKVLMDDFPDFRDNDETERSLEVQCRGTRRRPRGSTHRRTCRSTHGRPYGRTHGRPHGSTRGRPRGSTHERTRTDTNSSRRRNKKPSKTLKLTNITLHYLPPHTTAHIQPMDAGIIKSFKSKYKHLYCEYTLKQFKSNANMEKLPDMDTIDQPAEGDILLENNEIEEIVAKLPDESSYAPEKAQAITIYLQIIDESVSTEEILNDKEIISMIQADENEESIRQEIDEDEVPDPLVTATEVFNAMQTVIRYKEQEISESNLFFEELGFLRNLLKEYKR
ncbi:43548_t:CDS:2, partial [Gigaspora margarita]